MDGHESRQETNTLGRSHAPRVPGLLHHLSFRPSAHAVLFRFLGRLICSGRLTVVDAGGGTHDFGPGGTPAVTVRLHDRALAWRLLANPGLATGEAYMDGLLTIEEGTLHELLHLCTANAEGPEVHPGHRIHQWLEKPLRHCHQYNPIRRARANVSHHYDLSGALYDLFLDRDRQYSCAYFREGGESLEEAQARKKRHIAAKLLLEPGMTVLDVGSGWGGLALELAQTAHVEVTGITLSEEQLKIARARALAARLGNRVRFALRDYRDEHGVYDRVVSVGMFEHVGVAHFRTYFDTLRRVLKPDGVALVHAIGSMEPPSGANPWLRKYIFPGSYCPALSETLAAVEKAGLWVTDIEILRLHYAETLRHWSGRFRANRDRARAIYGERFCRMWEFYLASCEVAFRNGPMMVFQIQLARRRDTVPLARDYITDWERRAGEPTGIAA